jgi:hypothetical protein
MRESTIFLGGWDSYLKRFGHSLLTKNTRKLYAIQVRLFSLLSPGSKDVPKTTWGDLWLYCGHAGTSVATLVRFCLSRLSLLEEEGRKESIPRSTVLLCLDDCVRLSA